MLPFSIVFLTLGKQPFGLENCSGGAARVHVHDRENARTRALYLARACVTSRKSTDAAELKGWEPFNASHFGGFQEEWHALQQLRK